MPFLRALIVEDYEAFRRFIRLALQQAVEFQVIAEASDGLEAVQKAEELQPDLILLDIGLPKLNGLEAGRRIRDVSPNSKILFLSQESSPDVVREALKLGALGYVIKSRAQSDLLPAMKAVLGGEQFVSSGLELSEDIKVVNITELDEIRLRYAAIVDSSDDAIIAKDLQGVISAWNPAAQRMFGYTQEEALGQPITIVVPPELHARVHDTLRRLRAGERIEHFETRRVSKTGKTIDISLTISPIKDAGGRVVGVSTIARDITESKRVLAALRESEERLRLAQQAGRIGTFEWNIQTGVNTWTPELEAMYGLSPGSFGRTQAAFEALVHPDDRAEVIELVRAAMKTGQPTNGEWRAIWSDGSVHWIVGRWQVFKNESGEPSRMIGVNMEVTERKVAEQALRESEERFRLAAQAGRMYAFDWDVTTDVILRSEEITRLPGLAGEPTNLTKQQLLARIHPEDRATFSSSITELTPERPNTQISFRLLRPDGSVVWLERTGYAFFDEQGKMVRMVGMVTDITERKLAEEALSTVSQKLIEAHEEERSQIARELHDDIGQRLALLTGQLASLKRGRALGSQIGKIHRQCKELASNIQALSYTLHSPKLEYLGLARAAAGLCRELSGRHSVEIDFRSENIPQGLPREISLSLFRVLQEALQNATKHSGSRHFQVSLRGGANEIELTVHDSGIGFEPEEAIKGRGLGLTSMQERLKLVCGQLSIESKPQRGTTIQARVPLSLRMKSVGANG